MSPEHTCHLKRSGRMIIVMIILIRPMLLKLFIGHKSFLSVIQWKSSTPRVVSKKEGLRHVSLIKGDGWGIGLRTPRHSETRRRVPQSKNVETALSELSTPSGWVWPAGVLQLQYKLYWLTPPNAKSLQRHRPRIGFQHLYRYVSYTAELQSPSGGRLLEPGYRRPNFYQTLLLTSCYRTVCAPLLVLRTFPPSCTQTSRSPHKIIPTLPAHTLLQQPYSTAIIFSTKPSHTFWL